MPKIIPASSIDKSIRPIGVFTRLVLSHFSPGLLKAGSCGSRILFKGHYCQRNLSFRQEHCNGLRLCIFSPKHPVSPGPGVLWIHGGGYAMGVPEQEAYIYELFTSLGCTVVAPDYTLSTKAPYPRAIDDCFSALKWMRDNAAGLNIRADQLFVAGASAGGGLAAALCIKARSLIPIAFQIPLYPMLDDRNDRPNDAPVWNSRSNKVAWDMYLGKGHESRPLSPEASPSRLKDFSGLPPALTFIGDIEPFCQETVDYFDRLEQAGVPTSIKVFKGAFHAFDILSPRHPIVRQARQFLEQGIRHAIETYHAGPCL
ncbi:MAG: alpha/beta hydrolase [Sphaerochaetaceae bacterium]|jgi:acetyl esterase/lipase|nr:alpha/beta hydrolase [Sphaerochaetaceae bacterium]